MKLCLKYSRLFFSGHSVDVIRKIKVCNGNALVKMACVSWGQDKTLWAPRTIRYRRQTWSGMGSGYPGNPVT